MVQAMNLALACLKAGYSSSVIGHLVKLHVSTTKTKRFFYYSCIKLCQETNGCVAITFREGTNDCWLKSSAQNEPKTKRSFLKMKCLEEHGNVLFPGFSGKVCTYVNMHMES